jgi:glycosyltransferase involved in cell wall biosynthesis
MSGKPRVLFVGRGRVSLPLGSWLAKKWDALGEVLDLRVLNAGTGEGDPRFHLLPAPAGGFYPRLVPAVVHELRAFRPVVVVASDPYVGELALVARRLARVDAKLIVEVHGDPRTFTRAYGSRWRRTLSLMADRTARHALRRADATRALSAFTSSIVEDARGRPATASFPTWSDLSAFDEPDLVPLPGEPRVVFVGALERYKNVEGLSAAWRRVAHEVDGATLVVVGSGSQHRVIESLVADLPGRVVHHGSLPPQAVAAQLDASRALVLPSWPEGLGRVVLEAFARGRPAVATDGGGIPDIATDGVDALLVPPFDDGALVAALERVLTDLELVRRLGVAARQTYAGWRQTPADFARSYRDLVDRVLAGAR